MIHGIVEGVPVLASTKWGPVWFIARGYSHPMHGVVAQPYRSPDCSKPPPLERSWVQCLSTRYWLVNRGMIIHVVDPEASLTRLPSRLGETVREFAELLELEYVGVTGSYAVACEKPESDIDLVAYASPGVLGVLRDLWSEGKIAQCKHSSVVEKRIAGSHPRDVSLDPGHIEASLTDSCYKGVPYTLRLLRRLVEAPCPRRARVGYYEGPLTLEESGEDSILVPARYAARAPRLGRLILETWRTRYQLLEPGAYRVRVELYLEGDTLVATPDHGGYIVGGVGRGL